MTQAFFCIKRGLPVLASSPRVLIREEVNVMATETAPTKFCIKQVFELTATGGSFSHFMNEFAHGFLWEADASLVEEAPDFHDSVSHSHYVYAACFVHFWCEALLLPVPAWVYGEKFRHSEPVYTYDHMKEELERIAPRQFKFHNRYMRSSEVFCI